MPAVIMNGRSLATMVKHYVQKEVGKFKEKDVKPSLSTVMVGDDPASQLYIDLKHKSCKEVGITSKNYRLKKDVKTRELHNLIERLNSEDETYGILVQLPLPSKIDSYTVIDIIDPKKDVDGLNPYNMGSLSYKRNCIIPCTPRGIMCMLEYYKVSIEGRHAVIVNRSTLVGKPLMLLTRFDPRQMHLFNADMLLLNADAVVSVCHSKTRNLRYFTEDADILVSAVGQRPLFLITADMIKTGACIVDVGVSKIEGKIYGDVDFEGVKEKAGHITPNPGGVGPMTVAMLMYNTLIATSMQTGIDLTDDVETYIRSLRS